MDDLVLAVVEFGRRVIVWIAVSDAALWVAPAAAAAATLGYEGRAGSGWWRALWSAAIAGLVGWGVVWVVQALASGIV